MTATTWFRVNKPTSGVRPGGFLKLRPADMPATFADSDGHTLDFVEWDGDEAVYRLAE